jgi:hypothetical protein
MSGSALPNFRSIVIPEGAERLSGICFLDRAEEIPDSSLRELPG